MLWCLVQEGYSSYESSLLEYYNKKMTKEKLAILDLVKDHLIPRIFGKTTGKEMFVALVILYQSENINRKTLMKNKLRATHMSKVDIIASYLMKSTELCDQLAVVGE